MTDSPHPPSADTTASASEWDTIYDARYYDHQLHHEHWFHNNAAKRRLRWQEMLRMLELGAGDRMLEVGCAAGEHTLRLARLCREVIGIDVSSEAIVRASALARHEKVENVEFLRLDATNLGILLDASFDKVAAIDFVEHVGDDSLLAVLRECRRVLRPNGRLAIFTPCASHYVERLKAHNLILKQLPGHVAIRKPEAYRRLLAQGGFEIDSLYFSPSTYPLFGRLDRWFANAPIVGPWFCFRICIVARAANVL